MKRLSNATLGMTLAVITAACGGTTPGGSGSGSATGSGGGGGTLTGSGVGGTGGATQPASSSSVTVGVGGGGTGGGGGGDFVCDPAAAPGSIYERTGEVYGAAVPVSMCKYRGEVMLIVNTAALCGFTPQYAPLEILENTFKGQGLHVIGFLSNDFGNQGGTDGQVDACKDQYKVTFDQFAIDHVTGAMAEPVFAWLESQAKNPAPAIPLEPTWNFHKYLISRDGQLVAHWASEVYPGDDPNDSTDSFDTSKIVMAIKAELAKP